ncbi:putative helicase [compost metagenome]
MKLIRSMLNSLWGEKRGADTKLKELARLRKEQHPAIEDLPEHLLVKLRDGDESIMRYPPFTEGCPAWVPAAYLLKLHTDKLRMLKGGVGFDEANYERLIYPMLLNFADLVHMLPASQHHHHRGFGGLLRHGLEVAVNALNYAQCEVFDARDLPGRRDQRSTVWRVAAIAAGLMHDAGKVLTDLKVISEDGSTVWQPTIRTIPEWAEVNNLERYFLRWIPDRHESHKLQSLTLVERVIPTDLREWILENGEDIYTDMTMAIAGEGENRQLTRMIKRADSASVATDMRDHGGDASRSAAIGVPVASLILDAIKRLIGKGLWEVNRPGSPIWVSTQGVYIKWADACPDAVKDVLANGFKGIPRSADSLAAILIDHGIAQADSTGDTYWSIAIHMLRKRDHDDTKKDLWLRCLYIPDSHHIFNFEQRPAPVSISVKSNNEVLEFLTEKSAAREVQKETRNSESQAEGAKADQTVANRPAALAGKKAGTKSNPGTAETSSSKSDAGKTNRKVVQEDEVRNALGMSSKDDPMVAVPLADDPPEVEQELTELSTGIPAHHLEGADSQAPEAEQEEPSTPPPSTEDMLVAMNFLALNNAPTNEKPAEKKDLLKEALMPPKEAIAEVQPVETPKVAETPTYVPGEQLSTIEIPVTGAVFRLSEHAIERANIDFEKLNPTVQEKVRTLFVECGELRKYTPEMRVELPIDDGRFTEDQLHTFIASPLVFKSAIEGYSGLTYKYRKNWVCLTYDAAFLMASYDDAFIPFDVEIPEIDISALKRIVKKFCLPEVDLNHKSFYNLSKKAQTDIARYLSISNTELLNIFRVHFGSVRPSPSRATEIVFFGE